MVRAGSFLCLLDIVLDFANALDVRVGERTALTLPFMFEGNCKTDNMSSLSSAHPVDPIFKRKVFNTRTHSFSKDLNLVKKKSAELKHFLHA